MARLKANELLGIMYGDYLQRVEINELYKKMPMVNIIYTDEKNDQID